MFRPIRLRKAADEVVAVIVDAIRAGLFEPGDRLPRERDLAERLEVSRTTLREATRLLMRAGVVEVKRGNSGGVVVTSRSIPAALITEVQALGKSEIRSLLEVRRSLEMTAAVMAASRGAPEEFRELERLVVALEGLRDAPDEFIEVDFQFHLKVAEISRNALLHEFLHEIFRRFAVIRSQYPVGHVALERGIQNQADTLRAIVDGREARIRAATDEHLGSVEEHFLGERLTTPENSRRPR